jgi:hypothetical protein
MTLTANFYQVIFVKADAAGASNGSSWSDAYTDLELALSEASAGQMIWVAAGTYMPTSDHGLGLGDRGRHFRLKNGVDVYGGFLGAEALPSQRDPMANVTILSGDIGVEGDVADNCWHVFYHPDGVNLDGTAVLDGFTVTGGNADGSPPHDSGGGIDNYTSSPTVTGCTFDSNSAQYDGGGMHNDESNPLVAGCTFSSNSAQSGGGVYNEDSNPTFADCMFASNSVSNYGGGMYNVRSSPVVTDCIFDSNSSKYGGGLVVHDGSPTVTDCAFVSNWASSGGGGMINEFSGNPTVTNCTFDSNWAGSWGGGMLNSSPGNPIVTGCLFIANLASSQGGGCTTTPIAIRLLWAVRSL